MTRRRLTLALTMTMMIAVGLFFLLCEKPALYGDYTFSTAVQDRHGQLLRLTLAEDERYRLFTPLGQISDTAISTTLAYEDQYFYRHPGFNPLALLRAAWSTYVSQQRAMGGSTITMQLARMRFSLDTRTPRGKLKQIVCAVQLERHYSKDQILEAYLNLAPYGGNVEGIGTAALIYFDSPAAHLGLVQASALAVIPQNPVKRTPTRPNGYAQMIAARKRLIAQWSEDHALSDEQTQMLQLPLHVRAPDALPFRAPHFTQSVLNRHSSGTQRTTLDWALQSKLEQQISRYVARRNASGIRNASAMLIDYSTMDVLASVGSANFHDPRIQGQVNGTHAKRSPGSTLKPFVYGLAMDQGLIHPMSMLKDAPKRFGVYTPENFDRGFMGPVLAKEALMYSRNVPAIEMLRSVGYDTFHQFLLDAQVRDLKDADHYGLAMILGGNELSMAELTRLYALLANDGEWKPLRTLHDEPRAQSSSAMISAEASFLVLDMLRDNPRPDHLALASDTARVPVAWKTGTSYAFRDAWTVGVFGPYVLAVWVGNFDGSSNPSFVGRQAAAPLFFEIADLLTGDMDPQHYPRSPSPDLNLIQVPMCASTGDLPGRHCPGVRDSWFIPGVSPIKVSTVHRAIRIDDTSGLRTCRFDAHNTHEAVFEFWPSDLARLFRQAGISTRRPPPFEARCSLDAQAAAGTPPSITSPSSQLSYHIRPDRLTPDTLALTATTDADVSALFWFVNDSFVAKAARDEAVLWTPEAGEFTVLVVDDLGRSSSRLLAIRTAQ